MKYNSGPKIYRNSDGYNRERISSAILILFLATDLLRLFEVIPEFIGNILYVFIGLIAVFYSFYKKGIKKNASVVYFIFFYTLFGALGVLINGNLDPQELLWPFAFVGMAILLLNFKISYKISRIIYYFVAFLIMIKIVIAGGVNNLETASSRNTISIMILIYLSVYFISSYKSNRKVTIFPIFLGLVVNIIAIGRSGILTSIILVILFLPFKYYKGEYKVANPIKVIFILIIGVSVFAISYYLLNSYFIEMMMNFQERGLESIRSLIWFDYFEKTRYSLKYIFFGTPISNIYLMDRYNSNLHNSLLMLHAKYGVIILVVIIVLIINSFKYFIKTKNILYFVLLCGVVFRMQFDYTNFNAQLDVILFYLMFFPYVKDNANNNESNLKEI